MDDAPKNAIRKKVIKLLKKRPQGIPLNKLAEVFAQKYKQALLSAELGFPSVESFVDSLSKDLLVEDGVIFHKRSIVLTGIDLFYSVIPRFIISISVIKK